jgi:maltose O-acetyltransferase
MNGEMLASLEQRITEWLLAHPDWVPNRLGKMLAYYFPDARVRKLYLRVLGVEMGEGSFANPGFKVVTDPGAKEPQVRIGKRVSIGPNVVIVCDSRPNNSPMLSAVPYVRERLIRNLPVVVEDDVWIGASVTILPGVRVGRGAVLGAGAVVLADVEPFHVVAGVPARTLRVLDAGVVDSPLP